MTLGSGTTFLSSWFLPLARVFGSACTAISVQLILQFRILALLRARILFHIINQFMHDPVNQMTPLTSWWDPEISAEKCLEELDKELCRSLDSAVQLPARHWMLFWSRRQPNVSINNAINNSTPDDSCHRAMPRVTEQVSDGAIQPLSYITQSPTTEAEKVYGPDGIKKTKCTTLETVILYC
ncbi:hypothetical protein C8J56DRAFT_126791 [Mycena floridula]|nr:hypothetical protein C8J56DRAFT_126791 [Mycena floridula]